MHVFRSALSACILKDMPNVEQYLPLDRDRLAEERRKNAERNSRQADNVDSTATIDNESVNTVATQANRVGNNDEDNDDDVIQAVDGSNNNRHQR